MIAVAEAAEAQCGGLGAARVEEGGRDSWRRHRGLRGRRGGRSNAATLYQFHDVMQMQMLLASKQRPLFNVLPKVVIIIADK